MTTKERELLDALPKGVGVMPAQAARYLNLDRRCSWCPVLPPKADERCAVVPRTSRDRVERVLKRLAAGGHVRACKFRYTFYVTPA